jgi:hypothetical protein
VARILHLIGTLLFVTAVSCAQTGFFSEPPQVRAKNHIVALTLQA